MFELPAILSLINHEKKNQISYVKLFLAESFQNKMSPTAASCPQPQPTEILKWKYNSVNMQ